MNKDNEWANAAITNGSHEYQRRNYIAAAAIAYDEYSASAVEPDWEELFGVTGVQVWHWVDEGYGLPLGGAWVGR